MTRRSRRKRPEVRKRPQDPSRPRSEPERWRRRAGTSAESFHRLRGDGARTRRRPDRGWCRVAGQRIRASILPRGAQGLRVGSLSARVFEDNDAVVAESDLVVLAVKPGRSRRCSARSIPRRRRDRSGSRSRRARSARCADRRAPAWGADRPHRCPTRPSFLVRAGATAYFPGPGVAADELALVEQVLGAAGWVWRAPNEDLLDAVTGLSGSGPAYVFLLEALADAWASVRGCRGTPPRRWPSERCSDPPSWPSRRATIRGS
ncbi:MAG: pyrroline-5-carboxylate reductase dimerization domain-containing protein [Myxococcota bacterium]